MTPTFWFLTVANTVTLAVALAALLVAFSLRTFELLVDRHADQGALLTACNSALAPRLGQSNMQAAFLTVVVDGHDCTASVANAGLIAPLLWRDGRVAIMQSAGLPLGALPDARYHERVERLLPGDTLLLVSDGIVDTVLRGVYNHTADAPPHDDMTVVAIQLQRFPPEQHDRAA